MPSRRHGASDVFAHARGTWPWLNPGRARPLLCHSPKNPSHIEGLSSCAQGTITIARNLSCIGRSCSTISTPSGAAFSRALCGERRRGDGVGRRRHARIAGLRAERGRPGRPAYHYLPATADTVHWGYFSKLLKPLLEVDSGDFVTIEALTHHANDDSERMIKGDPGAESVFLWTKDKKGVDRRGAGPIDGKLLGRGAGEGFGVHICTGPVDIRGAEPGDILEVRIIDVKPRPCANPAYAGKVVRQQCGGLVGLPLQGPADRAEAARGLHHLRDRHQRAAQLGAGGL